MDKRKEMPKDKDKKVFQQTAKKTKALNFTKPYSQRGGIRL